MADTIIENYPDLEDTGEYIRFTCGSCGTVNGSTIHKTAKDGIIAKLFGLNKKVVVCGNCWEKFEI